MMRKTKRKVNEMEERTYSIELADGTLFENLRLNGNNFVSLEEITEEDFGDLSHVIITDSDGNVQEIENAELLQVAHYEGGYYFIIEAMSPAKVKALANDAQILFTAIATDTLLEEV